jgi:glycine/D-amino acid oxidase-like deaminating enzyme
MRASFEQLTNPSSPDLPPVVIGAGPMGLAAAAHLVAQGHEPILLEAGHEVGAGVRSWGHVRMFSPWKHLVDPVARAALEVQGWEAPEPEALPTGDELVDRYLKPLAALSGIRQGLRLGQRVVGVSREGRDRARNDSWDRSPFLLQVKEEGGRLSRLQAQVVLDCSGNFHNPNPLGSSGLPALGEAALAHRITYGIPSRRQMEREGWMGERILVVGSGHSAMNALLEIQAMDPGARETRALWLLRGSGPAEAGSGDAPDALSHRDALERRVQGLVASGGVELVTRFSVERLREQDGGVVLWDGARRVGPVDRIVAATGARPDFSILRELRLDLDPRLECPRALAPLIDPDIHTCETARAHGYAELAHPEPGFFLMGMKSYGRAPGFLLATGYEQIRSVALALSGDLEGARTKEISAAIQGACSGGSAGAGHSVTSVPVPMGHSESAGPSGSCCS